MGTTVTRAELVEALVRDVGLSRQDCAALLESILDSMITAMEAGETVKLARFGNFAVRAKRARVGRNPKTGVEAAIAARRVATFKPSPMLRAVVDGEAG